MKPNPIAKLYLIILTLLCVSPIFAKEDMKTLAPEATENSIIGVCTATSHDIFISKHYPEKNILRIETFPSLLNMLMYGKTDFVIFDKYLTSFISEKHPEFEIVNNSLFVDSLGVIFNKTGVKYQQDFNRFISEFKDSEVYKDMEYRWITKSGKYDMPEIETLETGEIFTVAVCSQVPPLCTIVDNKLVGFEVELIKRFAYEYGYKIKFKDLSFSALINALSAERVDAVIAAISIKQERKRNFLFSDVYYENITQVLALKKDYIDTNKSSHKLGFLTELKNVAYNNLIHDGRYELILSGLWITILVSVLSIFFGTILAGVTCYFKMSKYKLLNIIAKIYVIIMRGIPILLILLINFYIIFSKTDFTATTIAVISFAMYFGAYVSEMFYTGIRGIDKGQIEAGLAIGFNKSQTFIYIVVPQVAKRIMPLYLGESISTFKMTSIAGYIAVQDLTKVGDMIRSHTFDAFFPLVAVAIIYFIISYIFVYILKRIAVKAISLK
ncbi:MAG: ABC transporter substrate-binding protein/permease [Bacteroidales bacterium]